MITKIPFHSSETTRPLIAQLSFNQMAMHADRNITFTNQINQICNIDTSHDEEVIAKSADTIKAFLRKTIAAQSYGAMFANGWYFKELGQNIPAADRKFSFSTLHHLDKISKYYLDVIVKKTPNLNQQETDLINNITNSALTFRHQSNAGLAKHGKLNIFSNKKLGNEKIDMRGSIYGADKAGISNDDFVFFGVEFFSEDLSQLPLNTRHTGIDFGANAYLVKERFPHSYLTLTYHFDNITCRPSEHEHQNFVTKFPKALEEVFRYVHCDKGRIDIPMYNVKDMKLALGLHLVDFIRNSQDNALKHFALSGDLTGKELDRLINFIFQPEFHVPRMVSTKNFKEVKLREISLEEAIDASNVACLEELVKSKKSAREAMILAIEARKKDVIFHLFERFMFTKKDALLMNNKCELAYVLSSYGSYASALKLFIDKGLVDAFSPFKRTNKGDTMLDNAIKYQNEDMIALLRNLGVQTKEEIKFDLEEAVLSSNIERVNRMATSKEKISAMLVTAVANKKIEVVKNLLDKNKLTQEDMGSISFCDPFRGNLLYVLSDKDADINILRLFLDKGLINIDTQSAFFGVSKNMLDNARDNGRQDIVLLSKIYLAFKKQGGKGQPLPYFIWLNSFGNV